MKNDEFLIAGIAVDNTTYSFDRLFSYKVPDHLSNVKAGQRVLVPFGRGDRFRQGMILSLSYGKEENLKEISSILDDKPLFTGEMIDTVNFIHDRYFCTYYDSVKVMLPVGINYNISTFYTAVKVETDVINSLTDYEREIYDYLLSENKPVKKETILNVFSIGENSLNKLYRQGVVNREDDAFRKTKDATVKMVSLCDDVDINDYKLTPKQQKVAELLTVVDKASVKEVCYYTGYTQSVTDSLVKKKIARYFTDEVMRIPYTVSDVKKDEVILSPSQQSAFDNLYSKYCDDKASVSLLYGVTGSGKTSVFM